MVSITDSKTLSERSTQEIKAELLEIVQGRDIEPLSVKVNFYKNTLLPYFAELNRRNPFPVVEEQPPIVIGVWTPIWSTIPFHDILPGRVREQSYQIFHNDGFYANIARYAPGHQSALWKKVSSKLPAYDFMVMQKYEVRNSQWFIQNVGIFQALRKRGVSLSIEEADQWFTEMVNTKVKPAVQQGNLPQAMNLDHVDNKTFKKLQKTYLAIPKFEHIYIDEDLRVVKTQREASQRSSYTIAIRKQ